MRSTGGDQGQSGRRLGTGELVTRAKPVLDLAPRKARLIGLAGAVGIVLVVVGSLSGNRQETIAVDKLLHLLGYGTLAALFVLALPPRRYLVALGGLAALGALIELLQPLNARSRDPADMLANLVGLAIGAALGLGVRLAYGYVKGELVSARIRRRLVRVAPGTTIVNEGAQIERFFIVRSGVVELSRATSEGRAVLSEAGPGAMFGLLAEVLELPQYTTAVARTEVELYQVDLDDLIADAGGRGQPLGAVIDALATDLHAAWETIAGLRGAAGARGADTGEEGRRHCACD